MADTNENRASSTGAETQRGDLRVVVGLGASAGGVQALRDFFSHVAAGEGVAYVVVLHLAPDYQSKLAEVLQTASPIPVSQVTEPTPLEPDRVYVIAPHTTLQASADALVPVQTKTKLERSAPIDVLFRSLAEPYGARAVACVLSGSGADGSSGIKRIKECDGLVLAQDPATAEYPDMPRAAIATRLVDYVVPIAAMPQRIRRYAAEMEPTPTPPPAPPVESEAVHDILVALHRRVGHDFSSYKPATTLRRIRRRMQVQGVTDFGEYQRLLLETRDEAQLLMKELLISVTEFFRDADRFAALEKRIIPRLFEGRGPGEQVRAWTAGCATGEEAYSIAMLLVECAATLRDPPAIQVFGTDLDAEAIAAAREGLYTEAEVSALSPDRLNRFFQQEPGGYRIRRPLRELVLFAPHNMITDPPFSHLDLITCRNVLIYLTRPVQERLLETFHFALRTRGYLFLGASESPDGRSDLFMPVDKEAHVYESRTATSRLPPAAPRGTSAVPLTLPRASVATGPERPSPGDLHLRLLEEFAPPSLVATEEHIVVHVSEGAARFLHVSAGEPSRDLLKLVHPDLRVDLHAALRAAGQQRQVVQVNGVRLSGASGDTRLNLVVKLVLREGDPPRGYFLVQFDAAHPERPSPGPAAVQWTRGDSHDADVAEELSRLRSELRATIDQYERQVEEARAANEELQAANEELRSSTEELETSKEELQSVNEELTTVNQELKVKLDELASSNNDFRNLIQVTDLAAIFLDRALRVKMSTLAAQQIFNLLPTDSGRRLSDITHQLLYGALDEDVRSVLADLRTVRREVEARDGRCFVLRIVPYRTVEDRIDGVAITLVDISARVEAERRARAGEQRLRLLIDSATEYAIFTLTTDGHVDSWNAGAQRLFGYAAEDIIGRPVAVLFTPEDRAAGVPQQELQTAVETGLAEDERWHIRKDGSRFFCSGFTTRLGHDASLGFAKIARDLTAQRAAALSLERAREELEARVQHRTSELQAEIGRRAEAQENVARLLGKLVTAQEDQRARIARDLHDQIGQQLTALRLTLERVRRSAAGPPETREAVDRALGLAGEIDSAVDFLAWELRPAVLDHLGLAAALPRFIEEWSTYYGIEATSHVAGTFAGQLSPDAETTFYRVAQEALNNVAKHAHATRVDVVLEQRGDSVVLVVEDDGVGFDPSERGAGERGFGLAGMRERAALIGAAFQVESAAGRGTSIFLRCSVTPVQTEPSA